MIRKIPIAIITLVVSLLIFTMIKYPTWSGKSSDGKWEAVYKKDLLMQETGPHRKWYGKLYWNGNNEGYLKFLEFTINGVHVSNMQKGEQIYESIQPIYDFGDLGNRPEDLDQLEVTVHWQEGENEYEEKIILLKQVFTF